jgi:hypothetical protein
MSTGPPHDLPQMGQASWESFSIRGAAEMPKKPPLTCIYADQRRFLFGRADRI